MDFRLEPAGLLARLLALLSLYIGLSDAARLLGLGTGAASPVVAMGAMGFVALAAMSLSRLFAAVGLWMHATWGGFILALSLVAEVAFYLAGSTWVSLTLWGFIFKLVVMLATFGLFALARILALRQIAD